MKKLFVIEDTLNNKISYYHFILFAASMPFDRFYSELILISLTIHTVLHFRKRQLKLFPFKRVLLLQSMFIVTLFATIYTVDSTQYLKEWEKQLAIFLFPLLLAVTPLDLKKYRPAILIAFAASCTLTIGYLEFAALHIIRYSHLPFLALFSDAFLNRNFSDPIDLHPTYLAMYAGFSVGILLTFLFSPITAVTRAVCAFAIVLLSASLLQLGSKSVLFSFLFLLALCPFFLRYTFYKKAVLLVPIILTLTVVAVYTFPGLKKRFIAELVDDVSRQEVRKTKNESRLERWEAAIELIKESPVAGFGTGSEVKLLKKKYFAKKLYNSFINELNTHNQYLSVMIKAGLVGLVLFLATLRYGFSNAIEERSLTMLSFLVIITVVSFSENILEVNKGIFFYSFFFSLFLFTLRERKRSVKISYEEFGRNEEFQRQKMSVLN